MRYTARKKGEAALTARIQAEKLGVNLLVKTPIMVDIVLSDAYLASPEGIRIEKLKLEIKDAINTTGHSTPVMLKKYIKADELEVVDKIMEKYDYFK